MKGDSDCFDCAGTKERLHQYVDRELTGVEMAQVRRHLDDCPPCEQHFDFQEKLKLLVHRKGCPERAPQDLVSRILSNLR